MVHICIKQYALGKIQININILLVVFKVFLLNIFCSTEATKLDENKLLKDM